LENPKEKEGRIYRHCAGFVVLQRWRGLIGASENEFNCFAEEQDFSKYDILFYKELGPQVWKGATCRSQFATEKSFKTAKNVSILGNALKLA